MTPLLPSLSHQPSPKMEPSPLLKLAYCHDLFALFIDSISKGDLLSFSLAMQGDRRTSPRLVSSLQYGNDSDHYLCSLQVPEEAQLELHPIVMLHLHKMTQHLPKDSPVISSLLFQDIKTPLPVSRLIGRLTLLAIKLLKNPGNVCHLDALAAARLEHFMIRSKTSWPFTEEEEKGFAALSTSYRITRGYIEIKKAFARYQNDPSFNLSTVNSLFEDLETYIQIAIESNQEKLLPELLLLHSDLYEIKENNSRASIKLGLASFLLQGIYDAASCGHLAITFQLVDHASSLLNAPLSTYLESAMEAAAFHGHQEASLTFFNQARFSPQPLTDSKLFLSLIGGVSSGGHEKWLLELVDHSRTLAPELLTQSLLEASYLAAANGYQVTLCQTLFERAEAEGVIFSEELFEEAIQSVSGIEESGYLSLKPSEWSSETLYILYEHLQKHHPTFDLSSSLERAAYNSLDFNESELCQATLDYAEMKSVELSKDGCKKIISLACERGYETVAIHLLECHAMQEAYTPKEISEFLCMAAQNKTESLAIRVLDFAKKNGLVFPKEDLKKMKE